MRRFAAGVAVMFALGCPAVVAAKSGPLTTGKLVLTARPGQPAHGCTARRFSWIGAIEGQFHAADRQVEDLFGLPDVFIIATTYAAEVRWHPGQRACAWVETFQSAPERVVITLDRARVAH